ncbi:MAG: zinc ABC transporter substrate-binding protein, partial [Pseudomonadota bacterium]
REDGHGHDEHGHKKEAKHEDGHDDHDHKKEAKHEDGHDDHDHKKEAKHEDGHDDHDHKKEAKHEDGHDDHDHKKEAKDEHGHDDHDHKKEAKHEHGHDDHGHDHGDSPYDMHLWLDPQNAIAIVKAAEKALSEADPANAELYSKNAGKTVAALTDLMTQIKGELAGLSKRPFIVFHDAYAYFENRFGLEASAAITINPEAQPGAKRVSDIQNRIREKGVVCVFAEPQFPSKLVTLVTEGTDAKTGELDPLGSRGEAGPKHYTALIRQMADSFRSCLSS